MARGEEIGGGIGSGNSSNSGGNGMRAVPFLGEFDMFPQRSRRGADKTERGSGRASGGEGGRSANGGYWETPRSGGRRIGGGSSGSGGGSGGGGGLGDSTAGGAGGMGRGGRGGGGRSVVSWNDEVLRNLDGLGDPIG